jgi:hypothetical protein
LIVNEVFLKNIFIMFYSLFVFLLGIVHLFLMIFGHIGKWGFNNLFFLMDHYSWTIPKKEIIGAFKLLTFFLGCRVYC